LDDVQDAMSPAPTSTGSSVDVETLLGGELTSWLVALERSP
jgi:hypothetical protein